MAESQLCVVFCQELGHRKRVNITVFFVGAQMFHGYMLLKDQSYPVLLKRLAEAHAATH